MSGPRHPGTEGNDLWPADVKFPDPDGGDGRLSLVNDVAAEFSGLAISSTQPTDMPDGGLWINLSADATAVDRLSTYDAPTDAFIPIQADSTVVQDSEPAHSKGLIWFDSSPEDGFDMFFSDGKIWHFLQFIADIPDTLASRPDDDDTITNSTSDGLTVSFASNFGRFAFRVSNNTSGFSRARVYDFDDESYVFNKDISDKSADDIVVVNMDVKPNVDYGIELDNNGSEWTIGIGMDELNYPYSSDDVDIISQSRDGSQRDQDVVAINDIGNPENILG